MDTKAKRKINYIVKGAMLGALAMVVKYFIDIPIIPNVIHIRPHEFIVYASAFVYGPWLGAAVGFISDIAGIMKWGLNLFTLSAIFSGLVPGLFYLKNRHMSKARIIIGTIVSYVVVTMLWQTYIIYLYNGSEAYMALFMTRLAKLPMLILFIIFNPMIYKFVFKLEKKTK